MRDGKEVQIPVPTVVAGDIDPRLNQRCWLLVPFLTYSI